MVNRGVLHGFMHETIHELQQYAVGRSMVDHGMAYMMSNHGLDHGLVHGLSTYLVPVIVDHSGVIRTRGIHTTTMMALATISFRCLLIDAYLGVRTRPVDDKISLFQNRKVWPIFMYTRMVHTLVCKSMIYVSAILNTY